MSKRGPETVAEVMRAGDANRYSTASFEMRRGAVRVAAQVASVTNPFELALFRQAHAYELGLAADTLEKCKRGGIATNAAEAVIALDLLATPAA